jgi:molybdopterin synthase catalytic subunit
MTVVARLAEQPFDPGGELDELIRSAPDAGAVVSFVGLTRRASKDGDEVEQLVLEHHPTLTAKSLQAIADEGSDRFRALHVRVVHRCGALTPGEPIVFAGAASEHRRSAFECADYLMDRLKTEAVFWKREERTSGSTWIEPTDQDHSDRERWG